MGNRAVITTKEKSLGIYLHWNGGRDSVEAFLEYCKIKGYRAPEQDCYGWARLSQVIGNFFGGTTSVGIGLYSKLDCDNYDNGVYIIENWEIVGREFNNGEQKYYKLVEMLEEINRRQPIEEQINPLYFTSKEIYLEDIKVGDKVFVSDFRDEIELFEVVGIGKDEIINGTNVEGKPYTDKYTSDNINSYLREKKYRKV